MKEKPLTLKTWSGIYTPWQRKELLTRAKKGGIKYWHCKSITRVLEELENKKWNN